MPSWQCWDILRYGVFTVEYEFDLINTQGAQIIGDAVAGGGIQGISTINPPIRADISSVGMSSKKIQTPVQSVDQI